MNSKDLNLHTGLFLSCVCRAQEVYLSKIEHFFPWTCWEGLKFFATWRFIVIFSFHSSLSIFFLLSENSTLQNSTPAAATHSRCRWGWCAYTLCSCSLPQCHRFILFMESYLVPVIKLLLEVLRVSHMQSWEKELRQPAQSDSHHLTSADISHVLSWAVLTQTMFKSYLYMRALWMCVY